jgi:hypothetical protein
MEVTMMSTGSIQPGDEATVRCEHDRAEAIEGLSERRWQWQRRQLPSCAGREWLRAGGEGRFAALS